MSRGTPLRNSIETSLVNEDEDGNEVQARNDGAEPAEPTPSGPIDDKPSKERDDRVSTVDE